jgi:hypothetical protein
MVRYVPELDDKHWHESEKALQRVIDGLDDNWICFHHVEYLRPPREQREGIRFGEIDVLLAHPDYGMLTIEAKGGRYEWDQRGLRKPSGEPISPHPIDQGLKARSTALDFSGTKKIGFVPWEISAAFPNMSRRERFGPPGHELAMIWNEDLKDGEVFLQRIRRQLKSWTEMPATRKRLLACVERWVMNDGRVPPLGSRVKETNFELDLKTEEMIVLNEDQLSCAREEDLHQRTLTYGFAGTGKSVLASSRARRLMEHGYRVLFFTPNIYQQSELIEMFKSEKRLTDGNNAANVEAGEIVVLTLEASTRSNEAIERATLKLVDQLLEQDGKFDALIIDECQDVSQDLYLTLEMQLDLIDGRCEVHAFGDNRQASGIANRWVPDSSFFKMSLTIPCRCSGPIQELVDRVGELSYQRRGAVYGPKIDFVRLDNPAEQVVKRLVNFKNQESLNYEQVTTLLATGQSEEAALEIIREIAVLASRSKIPSSQFVAKTANSFKGCESDAVILVVDGDLESESFRRELYVGLSRAKSHLTVIASDPIITYLLSR